MDHWIMPIVTTWKHIFVGLVFFLACLGVGYQVSKWIHSIQDKIEQRKENLNGR